MDVHISLLKLAESWQKAIVADWRQQDLFLIHSSAKFRKISFDLLTVIVCLYWAEGQKLLQSGRLKSLQTEADTSLKLVLLWQEFCIRFGQKKLSQWLQLPDFLLIENKLIQEIIHSLYDAQLQQSELSINILGTLYETSLSFWDSWINPVCGHNGYGHNGQPQNQRQFKKTNGIYYTPAAVVQAVVQQTINCYFEHCSPASPTEYSFPQILDPTCGGGAFLLAAYQELLDRGLEHQLTVQADVSNPALQCDRFGQLQLNFQARWRILTAIHGVDLDPEAVTITQLSLWLKLIEQIPCFVSFEKASIPSVDAISIYCGNALTTTQAPFKVGNPAVTFCWQTTFPNLPNKFDIVIGNPPYIDAEQMTVTLPAWRTYCTEHYQTATGNWDLFCVFIEQSLRLCRAGGFTSLVVPNKLLSAEYASAARQLLGQASRLISIRDYSQVSVFEASVYPIVYVTQKLASQTQVTPLEAIHYTLYEQMQTLNKVKDSYPIALHCSTATAQPWLVGKPASVKLMQRLEQYPKLGAIAQVLGAATVAEAYLLKDWIQDKASPVATEFRLVNSGTIDRYVFQWGEKPLRYLRQSYRYPVVAEADLHSLSMKRLAQAKQPKIIVASMTRCLECAFDAVGSILAGKSTSIVLPPIQASLDLRYLLALLNSRLASFYILNCFQGNQLQGGYLRIGSPQLRQIPIVVPDCTQPEQQNCYQQILKWVDQRLELQSNSADVTSEQHLQLQAIDQKIDALVYGLYQLEAIEIEAVANDPKLLTIHG